MLRVFESVARDDTATAGDVDMLMEFEGQADFDRFMDFNSILILLSDAIQMPRPDFSRWPLPGRGLHR